MNIPRKKSRQREAILACVLKHHDHPTADIIYQEVRQSYPKISLGTVYRNLSLLTELGQIRKITCGDNADHFDGFTRPHAHFYCACCHHLSDLPSNMTATLQLTIPDSFHGQITEQSILLAGLCEACLESQAPEQ